jgi:hypothetical protein
MAATPLHETDRPGGCPGLFTDDGTVRPGCWECGRCDALLLALAPESSDSRRASFLQDDDIARRGDR